MQFSKPFFDPPPVVGDRANGGSLALVGDRRAGSVYLFDEKIVLAVNVAMGARRPLLVAGPPGTGKSSVATAIAKHLDWRYLERVITSRTQAQDLLSTFDALGRLNDAHTTEKLPDKRAYVEPGVLWWALDSRGAREHALAAAEARGLPVTAVRIPDGADGQPEAVILLDEIDKADPDMPNDLLAPLGSGRFTIPDTGATVQAKHDFLLVITTNGERDLAPAFVRRCVLLNLESPTKQWLERVADAHFGDKYRALHAPVAAMIEAMSTRLERSSRGPSTAEFLDAIAASGELGIAPGSEAWKELERMTLVKAVHPSARS